MVHWILNGIAISVSVHSLQGRNRMVFQFIERHKWHKLSSLCAHTKCNDYSIFIVSHKNFIQFFFYNRFIKFVKLNWGQAIYFRSICSHSPTNQTKQKFGVEIEKFTSEKPFILHSIVNNLLFNIFHKIILHIAHTHTQSPLLYQSSVRWPFANGRMVINILTFGNWNKLFRMQTNPRFNRQSFQVDWCLMLWYPAALKICCAKCIQCFLHKKGILLFRFFFFIQFVDASLFNRLKYQIEKW